MEKNNILYKCNWSPFENYVFDSKVTHTFINGKLAYNNGKFDPVLHGKKLIFNR